MAEPQVPRVSAKLAAFAHAELKLLVDELYTQAKLKAAKEDVLGALVLAARRSPIETIAAVFGSYVDREAAEAAKLSGDSKKP
jgi:hypothetical protein